VIVFFSSGSVEFESTGLGDARGRDPMFSNSDSKERLAYSTFELNSPKHQTKILITLADLICMRFSRIESKISSLVLDSTKTFLRNSADSTAVDSPSPPRQIKFSIRTLNTSGIVSGNS
jgi:hypothetical protein